MPINQSAVLNIIKIGSDRYHFSLWRPSEQPSFLGAGNKVWEIRVDPRAVRVLCQKVGEAVDAANQDPERPGISVRPFEVLGRGLYDALLPARSAESLRSELRALSTPLLISTDDPDVLWELMNEGDEGGFFCLKYDVGRSLRSRDVPSWAPPRGPQVRRSLIIADPTEDLPAAAEEALRLRQWLEARDVKSDYLEGKEATFEAVLEKLLEEYDIIHFAGHAELDENGEYSLRLHGGGYNPDNIRTFVKGSPIVFLNGCVSARAVGGLADAFIAAGARVVVGSMFDSPDEGARGFAEKFYEITLSGKPVGEAMRRARKHVMQKTEWAAAWACFVMYGDPCVCIELKLDELQSALHQVGLSREDFDAASGRILERAVGYGRSVRGVSTAHLFAAMVGGENPFLRDRLREEKVPPEALEAAFQEVFKAAEGSSRVAGTGQGAVPLEFSQSMRAILSLAKEAAQTAQRPKVSELDLVRGFVRNKGGRTGDILTKLGAILGELDPDATTSTVITHIGSLREADCSPDAWEGILAGVSLAAGSGKEVLTTTHLFLGLLQNPHGVLAVALQRQGVRLSGDRPAPKSPTNSSREVPRSKNVDEILLEAQANAAAGGHVVTDRDLLVGCIRKGGGDLGKLLARKGVVLEALTSDMFLDGGDLDLSRFDEGARWALDTAIDCARKKHYAVLGRRHLLYGLLRLRNGSLARMADDQHRDPELLADQLYAEMEAGPSRNLSRIGSGTMSKDLVSLLCLAESEARGDRSETIREAHLVNAWMVDGGGSAGSFLAKNGVKLRNE